MTTLASGISTAWLAARESAVQIGQTNAFDDDTSYDATLLAAQCGQAAAMVTRYLGDGADGDDSEAVELGVECLDYKMNVARVGFTAEMVDLKKMLQADLKELAEKRALEAGSPVGYDPDGNLNEFEG